ncbi:MAG: hypothetical protein ACRDIB_12895, partial [Ardenticatenaceae bacterium]
MAETNVEFAGKVSVSLTPVASDLPMFDTVMLYVIELAVATAPEVTVTLTSRSTLTAVENSDVLPSSSVAVATIG